MCDVAGQRIIEQVIEEKVQRGEMFTAFEISLEARRLGIPERHRQMKHVVHQFFAQGAMGSTYNRTLIPIPDAPCPAWLYHPATAWPGTYRALPRTRTHGSPSRSAMSASAGYHVDKRARICVPVQFLRQAGLNPGDEAVVLLDVRTQTLALAPGGKRTRRGQRMASYRVDKYGNVRIPQGTLQRASLAGQRYEMAVDKRMVKLWLPGAMKKP